MIASVHLPGNELAGARFYYFPYLFSDITNSALITNLYDNRWRCTTENRENSDWLARAEEVIHTYTIQYTHVLLKHVYEENYILLQL